MISDVTHPNLVDLLRTCCDKGAIVGESVSLLYSTEEPFDPWQLACIKQDYQLLTFLSQHVCDNNKSARIMSRLDDTLIYYINAGKYFSRVLGDISLKHKAAVATTLLKTGNCIINCFCRAAVASKVKFPLLYIEITLKYIPKKKHYNLSAEFRFDDCSIEGAFAYDLIGAAYILEDLRRYIQSEIGNNNCTISDVLINLSHVYTGFTSIELYTDDFVIPSPRKLLSKSQASWLRQSEKTLYTSPSTLLATPRPLEKFEIVYENKLRNVYSNSQEIINVN